MEREGVNPVQVLVGWTSLQENVKRKVFTRQCVTSQKTCVFSNIAVRPTKSHFNFFLLRLHTFLSCTFSLFSNNVPFCFSYIHSILHNQCPECFLKLYLNKFFVIN